MHEFCDACWLKRYDAVMELQAVLALGAALRWLSYSYQREVMRAAFEFTGLMSIFE